MQYRFIGILQHDIRWWLYDEDDDHEIELDDSDEDYIYKMIKEDYNCGELELEVHDQIKPRIVKGHWEIVNWKHIANSLYHAILAADIRHSRRVFEENWNEDVE